MAFALSLRGFAVLHASAVVTPFGACAFAATSGTGKSTLAASFQNAGYPTLTDDCLLHRVPRDAIYGVPSYPSVRLRAGQHGVIDARRDRSTCRSRITIPSGGKNRGIRDRRHRLAALYCLERQSVEKGPIASR